MEKIKSILKVSDQGVSRPFLCKDERDAVRWCKGNHTGIRSLIAEWMCARMARQLGLPVPDFAILRLELPLFREWREKHAPDAPEIVTELNPYVFASLNADGCKDVLKPETELEHIDKAVLAKIYIFDELVRNTDRTDYNSNLLVNDTVYIIDHNNAFDAGFSPDGFAAEHVLRTFKDAITESEKSLFRRTAAELASGPFLDEAWSELPEEWADIGNEVLPLSRIKSTISEEASK